MSIKNWLGSFKPSPDITDEIYSDFINEYGDTGQLLQLAEECAELNQAVLKYIRYIGTQKEQYTKHHLFEEMGDVLNALNSIKYMFRDDEKCRTMEIDRISKLKKYHKNMNKSN